MVDETQLGRGAADVQQQRMVDIELAGDLRGDSLSCWQRLDHELRHTTAPVISCAALLRMDLTAAGTLLSWVRERDANGERVQFVDAHRLIAALFGLIGITDHAQEQLAYAVAAAPAELARVRLQCALARWAGAAASASAAARMRGALFETRRHDGLLRAVRRWLAWRRRALVWRQKSLRRVAAAGGPLRLHNDHMRTFDARGLFVEFGNAVMAKTWRERRRRAVVFCAWALATHADVLKADSVLDAFSLLGPSRV